MECSADKILVSVQIVPDTVANHRETSLVDEATGLAWRLRNASTVLHMGLLLHLSDRGRGSILLSVVEGVILLRDLQTEDWVADEGSDKDESAHEGGDLRTLELEMHG